MIALDGGSRRERMGSPITTLNVVLNWGEELRRLVPGKQITCGEVWTPLSRLLRGRSRRVIRWAH
jgi:hypothetical protein